MWKFDIELKKWNTVDMTGFVPVERFEHVAFTLNETSDYFFIYGGYNLRHSYLDYVYEYCFSTKEWIRLQNRNYTVGGKFASKGSILFVDYNEIPLARVGMSCVVTKDYKFVIFGGKPGSMMNDMYICSLPGHCQLKTDSFFDNTKDLLANLFMYDINIICK